MKRSVGKSALIIFGVIIALLCGVVAWWDASAYPADATALAAIADEDGPADGVSVRTLADGSIAFVADDPIAGMVFYPGAKVDPEAYAPLLTQCAREGITCVLVKPPLNVALLAVDAADGVREQFPQIDVWLLGGHSLGGVSACEYLARHEDSFDGVVLLASYPNTDLTGFGGFSLQIMGTEDGVLNRDAYASASASLPANGSETIIDGGNHAYFGNYGEQDGDGVATISREQQQEQTVAAIVELAEAA